MSKQCVFNLACKPQMFVEESHNRSTLVIALDPEGWITTTAMLTNTVHPTQNYNTRLVSNSFKVPQWTYRLKRAISISITGWGWLMTTASHLWKPIRKRAILGWLALYLKSVLPLSHVWDRGRDRHALTETSRDAFTIMQNSIILPWHIHCPFAMTQDQILLPWHIHYPFVLTHTLPFCHDTRHDHFCLDTYIILLPWHRHGPFCLDTQDMALLPWYIHGPFALIHTWPIYLDTYMALLPLHNHGPFALTHTWPFSLYIVLLPWHKIWSFCPDTVHYRSRVVWLESQ